MSTRSIEEAPEFIKLTMAALQRAALRAREVARENGTPVVVTIDGEVRLIDPDELDARDRVANAIEQSQPGHR